MKKLSPFQWSSLSFFGYFCAYGVLLPFFPLWLQTNGFGTEQLGLLVSLGFLFRFLGSILCSQRIKEPNQLFPTIRLLAWASLVVVIIMAFAAHSIWTLLPVFALFHLLNGGTMPINDAIATTWQKQVGIDYSKTRLFGSVAFVIGSISTGYFVGILGEPAIIWIIAGWLLFLACGQMLDPSVGFVKQTTNTIEVHVSYLDLLKDKTILRMLLAVSLIQSSHSAYYSYGTIYWLSQGISTQISSILWGISVCAEVGLFFVANRLFKNWTVSHLIILTTLLTSLRWFILANTYSIGLLIIEQTFHAISFGLCHYAMVRFISSQDTAKIPKLQGLYFALASCGFMAIFTLVSGFIYQTSPQWAFLSMSMLALPALLIVPKKLTAKINNH